MEEEAVITAKDVASIYEVPVCFAHEDVDTLVMKYLHLEAKDRDLSKWEELVHRVYNPKDVVDIGIVGKYVEYEDSYKSLKEALVHGALAHNLKLEVNWIEAEGLETADPNDKSYEAQLEDYDGILVPGGFGKARHRRHAEGDSVCARKATCHISGFAWGCRRLASSLPATCAGWRTRIPASSIRRLRIA